MASGQAGTMLRHIHRALAGQAEGASDRELLHRFAQRQDEAAFAALVRRHGSMVLGVARRALHNVHDAEDVFQAAFLTLARKAPSGRWDESVAGWLHVVTRHLALRCRAANARRTVRETGHARDGHGRPAGADPLAAVSGRELCAVLDEELSRLSEHHRAPLVLCCLEGASRDEAARQLGWSLGTLKRRLGEARSLLRQRLARRGLAPAAVLSAALVAEGARAAVPPPLAETTCEAALRTVAGKPFAEATSPGVLALIGEGSCLSAARCKALAGLMLFAGLAWAVVSGTRKEDAKNQPAVRPTPEHRQPSADVLGDPLPPGAFARLGTTRFRHEGWVEAAAFSPDGRTLASAGRSDIIFWDAATGRERGRLTGNPSRVLSIAYSRDGKLLASGGTDNVVRLWDVAARKELRRLEGHKRLEDAFYGMKGIYGLAFTPDGRQLLSRATDETVRLWDVAGGKELRRWPGPMGLSPQGAALSPDGRTLATAARGPVVVLWDVASGKEIKRLKPPGDDVVCVCFSPDGKRLASGGAAAPQVGAVLLWDVATGAKVRSFEGQGGTVLALAFSSDGKRLASGSTDKTARVWDVTSGKELRRISRQRLPVYKLAFAPGDAELTVWGGEQLIHFWDLATGKRTRRFEGHQTYIESMALSPDGRLIASGSSGDVRLWDPATGKEAHRLTDLNGNIGSVAFSACQVLATGSYGGMIRLWDPATGKELRSLKAPGRWIGRLAFSPDGRMLAAWCQEKSSVLVLYDVLARKELRRLTLPATPTPTLYGLSFSPDGKILAAASGTNLTVHLWDTSTGNPLAGMDRHGGGLTCLAFSANGRMLAVGCLDRTITVWETAIGRVRRKLKHGDIPTSVAFSADGRVLASATNGSYVNADNKDRCRIRLWDVMSGKELRRLEGHRGGIYGLAFSPDGTYLASASTDTTVLLWRPRSWAGAGLPAKKLAEQELVALWADLDGTDAARAYRAIGTLAAAPEQALVWLRARLRPVEAAEAGRTARLLAALDSRRFAAREKAQKELAAMGAAVEGNLRRALKKELTPETRLRVERLLAEVERTQRLRGLRALELLEQLGTLPARKLVAALAGGDPEAWLTREAKGSLRRLQLLEAGPP